MAHPEHQTPEMMYRLHAETVAGLDALLPTVLDQAFRGGL